MDEDLVLVDNFHTETVDTSCMSNSPICTMHTGDPAADADSTIPRIKVMFLARYKTPPAVPIIPRPCASPGSGVSTDDPRTHAFDYTIDEKENIPSSSKEFGRTQESKVSKAGDQCAGDCVEKTKKSLPGIDLRPGLPYRRKSICTEKSDYESEIEEISSNPFRRMSPALTSSPPPPSPPFLAPPPPPPLSVPPFMDYHCSYIPPPPPPPLPPLPPPPPPLSSYGYTPFPPHFEVITAEQLIPLRSAETSVPDTTSPIVGILPFRRKVLLMRHQAHAADYQEYEWLLRFANTGCWYEKPNRFQPRGVVQPMIHPNPVCMDLPKVWTSAALTTSLDNDTTVVDQCQSKALKSRPLVYCLVLSTCGSAIDTVRGSSNGIQMYKLVRCGSREAAVTEAFFAAGVNGYNVAFACVMRFDEDFAGSFGRAKKVEQLSDLALENHSREDVRVFY